MLYLFIKSLHILAAILWVGALCLLCFVTSKSSVNAAQLKVAARITEASIGFTWLAGGILVLMGGWYASSWWQIKVALVVVISAIHTILHRRWKTESENGARANPAVPYVVLALTFVVVLLVVFKMPR